MSFKLMADNGIDISAKQDGALYNVALGGNNFIIKGLGSELELSHVGLSVSVGSGEAIIHGRHATSEDTTTIELPPNVSGYLVLRIDLTRPVSEEAYLFATPTITNEEINWGGTINDLLLAEFTTNSVDIVSFEDKRAIKDKSSGFEYTEVGSFENDKIIQIWEDATLSVGLYPTSVAEGIKWSASKTLKEKISEIEGVKCIDVNRLLGTNQLTYTNANEDVCIVCNSNSDKTLSVKIDNVSVCSVVDTRSGVAQLLFYLKKGHTLVQAGGTNKIYGVL